MNDNVPFKNWTAVLHRRAQLLHQQIAAMQQLARDSGANDTRIEEACRAEYRLLEQLYEHDMPVARALDNSDLLLHLEGAGLRTRNPRLSLVTSVMGDVRKEVGTMIKTLVSTLHESVELPREFDLGLSSFAPGSLYLGFSLPEPDSDFERLPGDPLLVAARDALGTLGQIATLCDEPEPYRAIQRDFADPKLRDAALSAVGHLAPSGRRGVSAIGIGGRAVRAGPWHTLTPNTRAQVRSWLSQPVLGEEVIEMTGRVRAIDLDLRRFDLRRVDHGNLPDLRCIYAASFDPVARGWLDQIVTVRGRVELYQGAARLMQLQSLDEATSTQVPS